MIETGDEAPDFTLEGTVDGELGQFSLSETVKDRPAVLAFYIYDYSPVCTDQVCEINELEFITFNDDAAVFGISTHGPYSHMEFAKDHDFSYPLLTDDEKDVYEQYGLLEVTDDGTRQPRRGIVVVDTDRTVRYAWQAEDNWDAWTIEPLSEANEVIRELVVS